MNELPGECAGQRVRPPRLIVDVFDQRIFHRNAPTGGRGVGPGGIEHLRDLPAPVHRDELIPQLVIGGMQGHREPHLQPLTGEPRIAGTRPTVDTVTDR